MNSAMESFRVVRLLNDTAHYEAHQNFIVSLLAQPCANVHSVLAEERCIFVMETEECRESMHYFDYMHFMYCFVDSSNVALFTVAIIGLLLAVALGTMCILHLAVDQYVNSILYVAKSFHLNEYIAGVTLLTYANGLPQVLSNLKHHHTADTELIYNQFLGTAVYQTAFIAAMVILVGRSFCLYPEVMVPNIVALIALPVLVEGFMSAGRVGIIKTVIVFLGYAAFLVALVVSSRAVDRQGDRTRSEIQLKDSEGRLVDMAVDPQNQPDQPTVLQQWHMFREAFRCAHWCRKIYIICTVPVRVSAMLLIPQVNHQLPQHGWNKYALILNLNLCPLLIIYTSFGDWLTLKLTGYLCLCCVTVTLLLSLFIGITTKSDRKPKFFNCVALFTVFGTSYLAMLLTHEVVAILETLCIIAHISTASFAITILSWGHCFIDLVTCFMLARRGYSRLAFAGCLGGPVFNVLIGLGVVFIVQMVRTGSITIYVRDGMSGLTCAIYLFVIAAGMLLSLLLTRFQARANLALHLLASYTVFLLYIVLSEFEVLHGYGTDHNDDGEYFHDQIPDG
ncbi:mitochondrial sodium/calcium exchanger protein-like [Anopheles albimanus]|uniref:Sodium/calcium exchanger membrane region domain-containing protein n=1 Tax=Anopheles albimanus TaxID=7167 RepID=A0A182FDA5_ANOAL|nr:mitochondrial sodium/calcium exchanger protein-like [Anopheles albimanus]